MNIKMQGLNLFSNYGLKSTQDRMERQAKRDSQVAFFEQQKENLKNMKSDSLDDISRKLEMLHSYDDQIAAAKEEYNNSQMFHTMDEARERGEKIAEEAKKYEPKTAEERREEMVEEATGVEKPEGILSEAMEELADIAEEMTEEITEELEDMAELTEGEISEEMTDMDSMSSPAIAAIEGNDLSGEENIPDKYKRIDLRI